MLILLAIILEHLVDGNLTGFKKQYSFSINSPIFLRYNIKDHHVSQIWNGVRVLWLWRTSKTDSRSVSNCSGLDFKKQYCFDFKNKVTMIIYSMTI